MCFLASAFRFSLHTTHAMATTLAPFRSGPTGYARCVEQQQQRVVRRLSGGIAARRPSCIAWFLHLGFLPAVRHWSILHVVPGLTTVYASGSRLGPSRASYAQRERERSNVTKNTNPTVVPYSRKPQPLTTLE